MKYYLPVILIAITSCAAPVSYVNNLPRATNLKEKGDVRLNVGLGSDFTARNKIAQIGFAYSPIQNFGIDLEYSGYLKLEQEREQLDKLRFFRGSLIYYIPFANSSGQEFQLGIGRGKVIGISQIQNFLTPEDFGISAEYLTYSFQTNYNFIDPSDGVDVSIGFRARNISFHTYTYDKYQDGFPTGQSLSRDNWDVQIIDPFVEVNQEIGENVFINTRASYSFLNGEIVDGFRHPFHRRLGFSLGLQFNF